MDFTATQAALTFIFNIVASVGAIALTFQFVIGFIAYRRRSAVPAPITGHQQPVDEDMDINIAELNAWDQRFAAFSLPTLEDHIVPFIRPQQQSIEDYSTWTVAQLRSLFNRNGLKWRNAGGDGKHLRKVDMINRLLEVNVA